MCDNTISSTSYQESDILNRIGDENKVFDTKSPYANVEVSSTDPIKDFFNFSPTLGNTDWVDKNASDTRKGPSYNLGFLESPWDSIQFMQPLVNDLALNSMNCDKDQLDPNIIDPRNLYDKKLQLPDTLPDSNMGCDMPEPNASNNREYANIFENPPPPTAECIYAVPDDNQDTECIQRRDTEFDKDGGDTLDNGEHSHAKVPVEEEYYKIDFNCSANYSIRPTSPDLDEWKNLLSVKSFEYENVEFSVGEIIKVLAWESNEESFARILEIEDRKKMSKDSLSRLRSSASSVTKVPA